ncbi:oxidoreductase domain-containing protein [Flammeovirgaceae bacterium 311]|nr:oxidoreductase domain-containing protein [Flammeovirgaceae bacterium 311]
MKKLKFAVVGAGFWSNYQIAAWNELAGVELVAVCDKDRAKAESVAHKFNVNNTYNNIEDLLERETLDFLDIITDVETHPFFTEMAASKGLDVICQKPMADSLEKAKKMVEVCRKNSVKFFVHENFRWQAPIRALKKAMDSGIIGKPFKARVTFSSAFPVFENQPFLAELDKFIITDVGSHVLDVPRFLFGEATSLYCLTNRVNNKIKGEDVANVLMEMESGLHCYVEMSYASILEKEAFPQTFILVEGDRGSLHLTHDYQLKITTRAGTKTEKIEPQFYAWANPDYAVIHSSIVDCNRDILNGLRGGRSETTGEDNFKTVELVWKSYESASVGNVIKF